MNRSPYFIADRRTGAHRNRRLASHPQRHQGQRKRHLGLQVVITLTFAGDLGTIFAAVSVVVSMPLPVTVLLVLTLTAASLFLAHKMWRGYDDAGATRRR